MFKFVRNNFLILLKALEEYLHSLLSEPSSATISPMKPTAAASHTIDSSPFSDLPNEFVKLLKGLHPPHVIQYVDERNHFSLNERVVAGESCWFAAKVRKI